MRNCSSNVRKKEEEKNPDPQQIAVGKRKQKKRKIFITNFCVYREKRK